MSNSDNFQFHAANSSTDRFATPFNDKQWWYALSQQSDVLNQVTFNLNSFFTESDKFTDLSQGYVVLPMMGVVSKKNGNVFLTRNDFAMCLKNEKNLINSFTLEIDGKSRVQSSQYVNIPLIFKEYTTMSLEEAKAKGVHLDSHLSWHFNQSTAPIATATGRTVAKPYTSADSAHGNGLVNNLINEALINIGTGTRYNNGNADCNQGLLEKMRVSNFNPNLTAGLDPGAVWPNGAQLIRNEISINNELKSLTVVNNTANDNAYQVFYYTVQLMLKDLCDAFDVNGLSLMKSVNVNLTLNLNTGNCIVNQSHRADADDVFRNYVTSSGRCFNYTCPIIACPQTYPTFNNAAANSESELTFGLYCGKVSNIGVASQTNLGISPHPLGQPRLYLPLVSMKPSNASLYLQNNQQRLVKYTDYYSTQLLNVAAGSVINFTVSQGIVGAKQLIVIPFISSTVNGSNAGITGTGASLVSATFSPLQSPFDSCPNTTSPLIQLSDFGVSMAGKEIIANKDSYGFSHFLQHVYGVNSINGDNKFNGLISKEMWENNYRYYVVNLERGIQEDDVLPKDIRLVCRNDNLVNIDLYIFVSQTKRFVCNVASGKCSDNVQSAASLE